MRCPPAAEARISTDVRQPGTAGTCAGRSEEVGVGAARLRSPRGSPSPPQNATRPGCRRARLVGARPAQNGTARCARLVEAADEGRVRRVLYHLRIAARLGGDRLERGDELVERLFALRLRR